MTCERCGADVAIGEWPWCPHGRAAHMAVLDDTLPGGARWMQNLGHEPVWVETRTQLRRELQDRGLRLRDCGPHAARDQSPWATRERLR